MGSSAYLFLAIDITVNPPKVLGCRIMSDPTPTTEGGRRWLLVFEYSGEGFADAARRMVGYIREMPGFEWITKLNGWRECASV